MKDFTAFMDFAKEHSEEIAYDVSRSVVPWLDKNYPNNDFSEIYNIISKTTYETVMSVLRQYHHWVNHESQK